ncbi:MAG: hypothetical protein ACYCSF_09660 [Acidimicrobiales bacterium]
MPSQLEVIAATSVTRGGEPRTARECQQGGYLSLVGANGTTFRNVGAWVSFAAQGGQFATGMIIPAGQTATPSGVSFDACDPLAYGYQLNFGANVQVANYPGIPGCAYAPTPVGASGATIGPFPTAMLLLIWLDDSAGPNYIFYSDGDHALVTGSNPWTVDITDSYFGTIGPNTPRIPAGPGQGNLTLTVTIS